MEKKIITALGSDIIKNYLLKNQYDVIDEIPYQDGVLEFIKRDFVDVIILSSDLSGEYDKYIFIEKIREIDTKIKIIVIVDEIEDNYKSFLYSKGIFHIFTDGKSLLEELEESLKETTYELIKPDLIKKNIIEVKSPKENENPVKTKLATKFQRQQIITFAGVGSSGKTTIASNFSKLLAQKTGAKTLLIDFDIINAGLNRFMSVKREPENAGYILPLDKNSSLNYMIDAIDKRKFSANVFDRYIVNSKKINNLDILTGNVSLYICKNILSSEYYFRILEIAKTIYDYIVIDTSGNIFLDSMQFSLLNSTKNFIVAEGNYVSLERTCRLINEFFPVWGVPDNKVQVIINKYNSKSLDKTIIKEVFKNVPIAGYIKYSDKYEELVNTSELKLPHNIQEEFYFLLESIDTFLKEERKTPSKRIFRAFLNKKSRI